MEEQRKQGHELPHWNVWVYLIGFIVLLSFIISVIIEPKESVGGKFTEEGEKEFFLEKEKKEFFRKENTLENKQSALQKREKYFLGRVNKQRQEIDSLKKEKEHAQILIEEIPKEKLLSLFDSLKPRCIENTGDTLYCFSFAEIRILARKLKESTISDTLINFYEKEEENSRHLILVKDSLYFLQQERISVKDSLLLTECKQHASLQMQTEGLKASDDINKKKIKSLYFQRATLLFLFSLISIAGVLK